MADEYDADESPGGESACYAHLLCQECGVVLRGGVHLTTCPRALASDQAADAPR